MRSFTFDHYPTQWIHIHPFFFLLQHSTWSKHMESHPFYSITLCDICCWPLVSKCYFFLLKTKMNDYWSLQTLLLWLWLQRFVNDLSSITFQIDSALNFWNNNIVITNIILNSAYWLPGCIIFGMFFIGWQHAPIRSWAEVEREYLSHVPKVILWSLEKYSKSKIGRK